MTNNLGLRINLATAPFRRERAQTTAYAVICGGLLVLLLVLLGFFVHQRSQASQIRSDIARQSEQLRLLEREQLQYSAVLGKPGNADIFAESVFLNQLIARRAVSWTKVFQDLATVLPDDMRVENIRLPQAPAQQIGSVNRVQLDMTVGCSQPEAILVLLKNLQGSELFGAPVVVNHMPPTQNDPLFKYRLTVSYAQKF